MLVAAIVSMQICAAPQRLKARFQEALGCGMPEGIPWYGSAVGAYLNLNACRFGRRVSRKRGFWMRMHFCG